MAENANEGDSVVVVLDKTVFYGESGGQVGDVGVLVGGCRAEVTDTQKLSNGIILHMAKITNGILERGDSLVAKIDVQKRRSISRNHSATHLLHKALREVLGSHVNQSGSYVAADYLRFDFTHFAPVTEEELLKVEDIVNNAILDSLDVNISHKSLDEAKKEGVAALFGEKYGSVVRVVKMGGFSAELCGGCHVENTSQIGLFKIVRESGVAAGIRRIEAITGMTTLKIMRQSEQVLKEVSAILKTNPADIIAKAQSFISDLRNANKEIETLKGKLAGGSVDALIAKAQKVGETLVVATRMDELDLEGLRNLGDKIRDRLPNAVIILATAKDNKINFVSMATKEAVAAGAHAGNIIREIAKITGGGGGGRPESAQAGGKDISKIDEAIVRSAEIIKALLSEVELWIAFSAKSLQAKYQAKSV